VALLGSNGVGKSTTLRTISGLHRPYLGRISIDGRDGTSLTTQQIVRAGVAHVPEGRQVFPDLSVLENIEMGAYLVHRDLSPDIAGMLDLFPVLGEYRHRRAGSLSGGEQQMLAIARGLIARPRLLLLDEPSLGLAPAVLKEIARVVRQIREAGTAIVLVEQNATLALDLADRGYVMVQGRVVLEGPANDLRTTTAVKEAYMGFH
jgi:branched-chain amino acid transport system ATP-binding protein